VTASRVDATLIAVPLSSDAAEIGYNIIGRAPDIIPNYQLIEISTPLPNPAQYVDHRYAEEALKELGKR
jgi:hypothetical protein